MIYMYMYIVGGDTYQEGLVSHRLGCAYEKINDYKAAIPVGAQFTFWNALAKLLICYNY